MEEAEEETYTAGCLLDEAEEVIRLTNQERENHGLDPLPVDEDLMELARVRAEEIREKYSHTRPDGTSVVDLRCGENIGQRSSAAKQVDAWMNSEGHRANILLDRYQHIGVGCYQAENGKLDAETRQPLEGVKIRVYDKNHREMGTYATNKLGQILLSGVDGGETLYIQEVEIVPDEITAPVVKHIFELCAAGKGPNQIARQLREEKVLTPSSYYYQKTGKSLYGLDTTRPYDWAGRTIADILENVVYLGHTRGLQTTTISYKNKTEIMRPKSEQVLVENTHEPIIDQELWKQGRISGRLSY